MYTHVSIRKLKEIHTATHPARMERTADTHAALLEEDEVPTGEELFDALEAEVDDSGENDHD